MIDAESTSSAARPGRRAVRTALGVGLLAALALGLALVFDLSVGATLVAVAVGALILRTGWFFLQSFATPPPEPPEPGELRKVKLTYRCGICGAEVRMTVAATEDPEPPRHCMEDMDLVTPVD